ncbi:MAG: choline dehydrogenase [Sphingomonadales bacterium]|jgi:choline dehydrogenase-like flavoprotein|nr:choline dehydrogenase [Sphingomonadales bacterium]
MGDGFDCDYIVIGSGAGGGTVAARLAEAGKHVILLEAGDDPMASGGRRFPCDYQIPAFHPFASENPAMAWNYWVEHYPDPDQAKRDWKRRRKGVLYPRAGTLGGCTAHNAMIFMLPQDSDWDGIAAATGDDSWKPDAMARFQHRVENCRHRKLWRWLARLGLDPTGHGWKGWLSVEVAMPLQAMEDRRMRRLLETAAAAAIRAIPRSLGERWRAIKAALDPNDRRMNGREGLCFAPVATHQGCRVGTRDRVEEAKKAGLEVRLNALASRLVFADDGGVCGVDYLEGRKLYRAAPGAQGEGARRRLLARREVILAGGAFNSPQLLMLSGIGPSEELAKHDIPCRADLPLVGRNLQDRYEVCVLSKLRQPWASMKGALFSPDDPIGKAWSASPRGGMYISNGAALAMKRKSDPGLRDADLFVMALLGCFNGYYPGYSRGLRRNHDVLSWAILKARTANRAGTVRLRGADPRDPPLIQFDYFSAGAGPDDIKAVAEAVRMVREIAGPLKERGLIEGELCPGPDVTGAELEQWIRDNAWGHHASCTCPMGRGPQDSVLDGRLRVHGVPRLRVVDASIFPRIPGYFIVSAIYMAAEKAAAMILEDADAEAVAAPARMEEAA